MSEIHKWLHRIAFAFGNNKKYCPYLLTSASCMKHPRTSSVRRRVASSSRAAWVTVVTHHCRPSIPREGETQEKMCGWNLVFYILNSDHQSTSSTRSHFNPSRQKKLVSSLHFWVFHLVVFHNFSQILHLFSSLQNMTSCDKGHHAFHQFIQIFSDNKSNFNRVPSISLQNLPFK